MKVFLFALVVALVGSACADFIEDDSDFERVTCVNQPDGALMADPVNCARYIQCIFQTAFYMTCPNDQLFDENLNRCNQWSLVNCGSRPPPITTQSTTYPSTTTSPYDCPPFDDPFNPVRYPFPYDCKFYYECSKGSVCLHDCSPWGSYHFSVFYNRCVDWGMAGCTPSTPFPSTTPTPTPTTPSTTVSPGSCIGVPSGTTYADPLDCRGFFICYFGTTIHAWCDDYNLYSTSWGACQAAALVDCGDRPIHPGPPTTPSTTPSTTITTIAPPRECTYDEWGNLIEYLPHATDCTLFYKCSNGVMVLMACPNHLHWNHKILTCDHPESANCQL